LTKAASVEYLPPIDGEGRLGVFETKSFIAADVLSLWPDDDDERRSTALLFDDRA
jgi:hypothetical protein